MVKDAQVSGFQFLQPREIEWVVQYVLHVSVEVNYQSLDLLADHELDYFQRGAENQVLPVEPPDHLKNCVDQDANRANDIFIFRENHIFHELQDYQEQMFVFSG
jgi:hypothetical protein